MSALCIGNNDACISLCHALSLQMIQGVSILFPPATFKFSYVASDSLKGILKCLLFHPNIQYLSDVWFKATDWVPKVRTDWRPQRKKKKLWLSQRPEPTLALTHVGFSTWAMLASHAPAQLLPGPSYGQLPKAEGQHLAACPLACFQTHIHI